jgi:hypothetical protein
VPQLLFGNYPACCRFYFVSDPTLLEILSLGSDPPSVVPHFQSGLFDSLSNVTFDKVPAVRQDRPRRCQAHRRVRDTAAQKTLASLQLVQTQSGNFM